MGIIPAPVSIKKSPGEFQFSNLNIVNLNKSNKKVLDFFIDQLKSQWGYKGNIHIGASKSASAKKMIIDDRQIKNLPAEAYRISVTPDKILITGQGAGLFYAMETMGQLLNNKKNDTITIPCVDIIDYPRFKYRGVMLDVSRHFFTAAQVERIIDLMAFYKLNNFHWHLVDNEGWRIQIKKYPLLTSIGAYRTLTSTGGNRDWPDALPYGGYYTQDDIKAVVKYAARRYINIIPEIEMPAHSDAVYRAYPQFFCLPNKTTNNNAVNSSLYCPTEQTFNFLEDVLTEVMALFPGKYVHIGGDEAKKDPWIASAFSQQLIKKLNLKDERGLQSYFIQRIEKFVNSKGHSIIGWDEIAEGGLSPNATVMCWRGQGIGVNAALQATEQKQKVIMTLQDAFYFDYYQSKSTSEPLSFGGYLPLWQTYNYDPVQQQFSAAQQPYIWGVQGNIWTEYISTVPKMEYMSLPRMLALAEVGWSPTVVKSYADFSEMRLPAHLARLDRQGYNYRVPATSGVSDTMMIGSEFRYKLSAGVTGAKIYYTLNGYTPDNTDVEYQTPLYFKLLKNEKLELQTIVITPSGKRSVATRTVMYNCAPLAALSTEITTNGLNYKMINSVFTSIGKQNLVKAGEEGITNELSPLSLKKDQNSSGLIYEGFIRIDEDGTYNFGLSSVYGSQLYINNIMQIDNDQPHNVPWGDNYKWAAVPLLKGLHPILIKYNFNNIAPLVRGTPSLKILMNKDGGTTIPLPMDRVYVKFNKK